MKNRLLLSGIGCVLLGCVLMQAACTKPTSGPRFTWTSFQRFWDKSATPLTTLREAKAVPEGYLIDYGSSTVLTVRMEKDIVTGVHISFVGGKHNDAGGPQFLRLMQHAVTVGTFHWPEEEVRQVRELFARMSTVPKEYLYQATHFQRGYEEEKGWFFSFTYVDDSQNPAGRAKLPE